MNRVVTTRNRRLERLARRELRRWKIGVIPDVLAEVLRTERHASGADVSLAYLHVLTRRITRERLSRVPEELRKFVARELARHIGRIERPTLALPAAASRLEVSA